MRQNKIFVVTAVFSMLTTTMAVAQQPTHQHDAAQQTPASSAKPSMPAQGSDAHMAQHVEMCRQMMGQSGMMGGGMMSMPTMMGGDPKQQADMLAMRGEMMKAMGDIMMKYAQRVQPVK